MTKKADKPPVTRRFIACTQSTGRVGKSFTAEGLITALNFAGVSFAAVDADNQHRTLARRYPNDVERFDATRSIDEFSMMIQALPPAPVILVDFPAQATGFLLAASRQLQLLEFFEGAGIRPTLLIFAADDPTAKDSAADTVRYFEDHADYLLIENPARFKSDGFKQTKFARWFEERKTPTIRIPAVTATTINAWERLERKHHKPISFDELRVHPEMHELSKLELEYVRNRFLAQFEDCASRILPDIKLIKNRVSRVAALETQEERDPLDDEFFA